MKKISQIALALGLGAALGGCATSHNMNKAAAPASNPVKAQLADFTAFGGVMLTGSGLQLVIPSDGLFKKGSSHLAADGIQKIDGLAAALSKHPGDSVTVVVYTDNSGTDANNLKLSQHRADHIKKELVKRGLSTDSVMVVGKGSADPVAANDTEADRAQNRRAEFDIASAK